MKVRRLTSGIATLEAALMLIVAGAMAGGAAATVDYLVQVSKVRSLAQATVVDSAVRPLKLSDGVDGALSVYVNEEGLSRYIDDALRKAQAALSNHSGNTENLNRYFLEMGYGVLEIDPGTGRVGSISTRALSNWTRGAFSPFGHDADCPPLETLFGELRSHLRRDSDGALVSQYAVPDALYGGAGGDRSFLPQVVAVGMRVFHTLEGSFGGDAYAAIGGDPVTIGCAVTVLRGDVQ